MQDNKFVVSAVQDFNWQRVSQIFKSLGFKFLRYKFIEDLEL